MKALPVAQVQPAYDIDDGETRVVLDATDADAPELVRFVRYLKEERLAGRNRGCPYGTAIQCRADDPRFQPQGAPPPPPSGGYMYRVPGCKSFEINDCYTRALTAEEIEYYRPTAEYFRCRLRTGEHLCR